MSLLEIFLRNRPTINIKDIKRTKEINNYEILIEQRDGEKYIYDTMTNTVRGCQYNGELSRKENNYEFKFRLRAAIEHSGILEKDLADKVGISNVSLSRYLNGSRVPGYAIVHKIAKELNVTVQDLYFDGF